MSFGVVFTSSFFFTLFQGILTKLSQNKDSTYDYDTATVPFLGEIFKVLFCEI